MKSTRLLSERDRTRTNERKIMGKHWSGNRVVDMWNVLPNSVISSEAIEWKLTWVGCEGDLPRMGRIGPLQNSVFLMSSIFVRLLIDFL